MQYKPDPSSYQESVPGVFMKMLSHGENSMLCEFQFKKGAIIPVHQHPHEQTGYLVRGSLHFFGDEGESVVDPDSSWNFKGGTLHGAEALEDSVLGKCFPPCARITCRSETLSGYNMQTLVHGE